MKDGKKYPFNKINKSNFDLSANRPSNYRYENNTSNISYNNQNIKNISGGAISSDDIKKKFNKKLINQVIHYSNSNINENIRNNNLDTNNNSLINNKSRDTSKSEDNANNNIYNFNYIYNNNNFDMNIVGNNLEKKNNYNLENKKNNIKKKNNNNNSITNDTNKINKINNNLNKKNNNNNNNIKSHSIDKDINSIKNKSVIKRDDDSDHWTCDYCSNMNRNDYIYCKICKRNKKGKRLRINTQLLNSNHNHNLKKYGSSVGGGVRPSTSSNKKSHHIAKNKKMQYLNNNSLSNRVNKNIEYINNSSNNNINNIKKMKRNTVVGFPFSKDFNSNDNYNNNNYANNNQQTKLKYFNDHSDNDIIKKEYSLSKGSFNERNNNIY
jgi:hypothetical protein